MRWIVAALFGALFFMARPQIHWEEPQENVKADATPLPALHLPVRTTIAGGK